MHQPHSIERHDPRFAAFSPVPALQHRAQRPRAAALIGTLALLAGAAFCAALPASAFAQSDAVKALAAPPPIQLPLKPSPEFAKFPRYVGMLGDRQIVLRLGPKTDDPSGVHGEYQFVDNGAVILIAGDREDSTLEVEESDDGTRITGNWVGKFSADGTLDGERMDVDDSNGKPFDLHPLAAGQPLPSKADSMRAAAAALKDNPPDAAPDANGATGATGAGNAGGAAAAAGATGAPASQQSTQPATATPPAAPAGHAVNGVGNLTTGD